MLHSYGGLTSDHSLGINDDRVDLCISIILYRTSCEELTVVNWIQVSSDRGSKTTNIEIYIDKINVLLYDNMILNMCTSSLLQHLLFNDVDEFFDADHITEQVAGYACCLTVRFVGQY